MGVPNLNALPQQRTGKKSIFTIKGQNKIENGLCQQLKKTVGSNFTLCVTRHNQGICGASPAELVIFAIGSRKFTETIKLLYHSVTTCGWLVGWCREVSTICYPLAERELPLCTTDSMVTLCAAIAKQHHSTSAIRRKINEPANASIFYGCYVTDCVAMGNFPPKLCAHMLEPGKPLLCRCYTLGC